MMNWFDIAVIISLLVAFFTGYRKGLVMQLAGLFTIILAAIFGGKLAKIILPELQKIFDSMSPHVASVFSYIVAFAAIALTISIVAKLIQGLFVAVNLNFVNRILGSMVALASVMLIFSLLLNLALMLDSQERVIKREIKENSFFYKRVQVVGPSIVPYLNKETWEKYIPENYRKQMEESTVSPTQIDSVFQKNNFKTDTI